jgi:DNA-binding response OmpR family regulator/anti-sigma regulatory factor (Ser/Thr protein kinase)
LSTVSHELRTPLTSVLGFAKIIKKRLEDRIFPLVQSDDRKVAQTIRQVEENLAVVVSEGERLTKLIDDVLDLAKIEAGKLEWHMEPVSVEDIVDRATAATSSLLEQKGLHLVKEIAAGLPSVSGDRDRLIQVVINLISNAVKFTDTGSVTCRAVQKNGTLVVSISDTGMGIAPADQPKVFERFKQVGDTLTDKPKGTGLGLPICREIVEHHRGQIWVESEVGKGSTFAFSLPTVTGQSASRPLEIESLMRQLRQHIDVAAPARRDRQPSILVVDDDPHIRELLNQEFTEAGFRVRMAGNGREALGEVRRERPDLVVLDVMMPEINGFDVAAVLKNDPQTLDIPIIILSIVQDRERGFRLGVDRYLTKPIDTSLLFREVDTLLAQGTSHKRVLVVDEDATTVKTLADVLTARGYHVTEANGAQLLEKAVAVQPDIIILSTLLSQKHDAVQSLRFEKGLENVVFVVYQ